MMRLKFHFQSQQAPVILPIYYHATIKRWFEAILEQENISYKTFNFGKPYSAQYHKKLDRNEFTELPIYWIFSIATEKELNPDVFVGKKLTVEDKFSKCELWIESVEWIPKPAISPETIFRTITPVCATKSEENKTLYLSPTYSNYEELIKASLIDKYQKIYGKLPENADFHCKVKEMLSRTILVNLEDVQPGLKARGYEFEMKLSGSKELIEFAWEAGLGEYTDLGLGMIDIKN